MLSMATTATDLPRSKLSFYAKVSEFVHPNHRNILPTITDEETRFSGSASSPTTSEQRQLPIEPSTRYDAALDTSFNDNPDGSNFS